MAIRVQKQKFYGGEEYEESFYFFKRSVFMLLNFICMAHQQVVASSSFVWFYGL